MGDSDASNEDALHPNVPLGLPCPNCGSPLRGYGPDDICAGYFCSKCDSGLVTTNPNFPGFDQTAYSLWIDCADRDRAKAIVRVGSALGIGVKEARERLDTGRPVLVDIDINEVRRLFLLFRTAGLGVRVEPICRHWRWVTRPPERWEESIERRP